MTNTIEERTRTEGDQSRPQLKNITPNHFTTVEGRSVFVIEGDSAIPGMDGVAGQGSREELAAGRIAIALYENCQGLSTAQLHDVATWVAQYGDAFWYGEEGEPAAANPDGEAGYRAGMLCEIDGVEYWHTGNTYHLGRGAVRQDGTREEFDLRLMPGYQQSTARVYEGYMGFPEDDWEENVENWGEVKDALAVVSAAQETLYWKAVIKFLHAYHERTKKWILAMEALEIAGFSHDDRLSLLTR